MARSIAASSAKNRQTLHDIASEHLKHLAGRGLLDPKTLSDQEVGEISGSLLAHVAKREQKDG